MTVKDNLKSIELEQIITKQTQEIQDLKRLVADLGEKITRDIKTEEEKKQAGTAYWSREIIACNKDNYYTCVVCEDTPKTFHFLKIRTCSPNCSIIIENLITTENGKGEKK